jgi:lipopolysaccharide transport system permease protein
MFGETPHWGSYLVLTAVSLLVAWLGYLWFMKSKKTFADVV